MTCALMALCLAAKSDTCDGSRRFSPNIGASWCLSAFTQEMNEKDFYLAANFQFWVKWDIFHFCTE